jgi:hypothetical protein
MERRRVVRQCVVRGAWFVPVALLAAAAPAVAQTSLSIYRDGRVVVRRTLPQALQHGRNAVALAIDGLDPATLFSPDTSVTVVSAVARYPTTADQGLTRAVGQTLAFARDKDTVRATVVRADPPQLRLADGRFLLGWPGTPLFPAGLVRTAPEADVVLEASRARPRTELAFVGQGMTWEAVYQVVLGRGTASVTGAATVTSQAMRVDSAEVQLVAGSIRRTRYAPAAPPALRMQAGVAGIMEATDSFAGEQAVGESHVYALPGRLSLEPGVPVTTALFPRATAPVTQEFIVPGVIPWRGYFGGVSTEPTRAPVQVWYTVKRARGSAFGDRPLPAGTVQLYEADAQGRVQLVGEASIGHTPAGRDVRVQSGDAFDLTAERVQTDYQVEQLPAPRRGAPGRQRVTAALRVTLTSAKAEPVTVDVRETHVGEWRVTESSVAAEKLSASEVRFRLAVPANGSVTLTYTVQIDS